MHNNNAKFSSLTKRLAIAVGFSLLAGCTVMPGGHVKGERDDSINMDKVKITTLTNDTIAQLNGQFESNSPERISVKLEQQLESYQYRIGVGDVLSIIVWDHPELTTPAGQFRDAAATGNPVRANGTIFYPYAGNVKVVGKTAPEVRLLLTKALSKTIQSPQVDVSVAAFQSQKVYMTGEVQQSGVQPITNVPLTLLDAINNAGGLTETADWRNVTLTRYGNDGSEDKTIDLHALYQKGELSQNTLLRHNDVIHVARNDALNVFVMGEIKEPDTLVMNRNGMSLAQALSSAGGINEGTADATGIFVLRAGEQDITDVYQLNAQNAVAMVLAAKFQLQPNDVVYVTAAPIARWNRIITQLAPTALMLKNISDIDKIYSTSN
ncbi:polysaccharide export protein [Paraferrimonas haliotis]|uniref:Polysaccharide export protein Wza n=1 Tax=Paraferrimonas haliotis TaxID=2013866 RepID=A0AA37TMA7_9GAMM|nr:polysaccharide export protein [Paraferrimonas haliotis]GLS82873.1 polysaccharide export protein Wza [Paraferrimonas haliotis]